MIQTNRVLRFISLTMLGLSLSGVFAQTNPLVGTWQTAIQLGQGLPPATGVFTAQPNGQYREEMIVQGQLAAYWEGQYSLSQDGTLIQQEISKSPQICLQGQCVANEGPATIVSRVSLQGPDTFTATVQDPASGQTHTINWQRVSAQPSTNQPNPLQPNHEPAQSAPTQHEPACYHAEPTWCNASAYCGHLAAHPTKTGWSSAYYA